MECETSPRGGVSDGCEHRRVLAFSKNDETSCIENEHDIRIKFQVLLFLE